MLDDRSYRGYSEQPKNTDSILNGAFGNNLEVMYISNVMGKYSDICPLEEDLRRYTQAKMGLTRSLKAGFVANALCKLSYLFPQPRSHIYCTCHP